MGKAKKLQNKFTNIYTRTKCNSLYSIHKMYRGGRKSRNHYTITAKRYFFCRNIWDVKNKIHIWPSHVKGFTSPRSASLKNHVQREHTRNPEKIRARSCMDFFISRFLDHTHSKLSSDDVQHGEYVINGGSGISVFMLTKL